MKTVGRVRKSMKKRPKTMSFSAIFDLEGNISKFLSITFWHMAIYTFPRDTNSIQRKLCDEFAKVRKNDRKRRFFAPL